MDLAFVTEPDDMKSDNVSVPAAARRPRAVVVGVILVICTGVVLRFVALSHLWLDEALSVNIARLPPGRLFAALRHDGAPPLYYLVLHVWIGVFGSSPLAVRALSGLASVAALPLVWVAGRRLAGRTVAWTAVILLATSPFAVRYATEARMYALVVMLVLVALLALLAVLDGGSRWAAPVLAAATGLLLLTHYWAFYLGAAVVAGLAWRAARSEPAGHARRRGARRALMAMAAGCVIFVPWIPSFLVQMAHTGTPWAAPARIRSLFDTATEFAGGYRDQGEALAVVLNALIALAIFGRAVDTRRIELDLKGRTPARELGLVAAATVVVAIAAGSLSGAAYSARYASVVLPMFLLVAALGIPTLGDVRLRNAVIAAAAILGVLGAATNVGNERTHAGKVASELRASARPGDVVAYCPDQLGPSVSRLLPSGRYVQLTFPDGAPPQLVDWSDYAARNRAAHPGDFARHLLALAGPGHDVWLVWAPGYRTLGSRCSNLVSDLGEARPNFTRVVKVAPKYFERPGLVRFPAGE